MHRFLDPIKQNAGLSVFILLAIFVLLSLAGARNDAATFDERAHIPAAYSYVRHGDMRLNPEHPPLLKDLAGLPLLLLDLTFPIESELWTKGVNEQWNLGTLFLYRVGNNPNDILFFSRLPIILLGLLLGYFLYRWGKELSGTLTGIFAVALFALDPNMIAHSHYVTTDLGIAAAIFIATYFFVRFLKNPSTQNIIIAGIALSLAQLTKFSAVLLFPLFGLILFVYAIVKYEHDDKTPTLKEKLVCVKQWIIRYIQIVVIAFIGIYIVYAANTWNMPAEKTIENAAVVFSGEAPAKVFARETIGAMSSVPVLKPLSHYFLGVFMVFSRVAGGNTFYFDNPFFHDTSRPLVANIASPWYFPAVFLMKETLPFLFLLFFAVCYALFRIARAFMEKKTFAARTHLIAENFRTRIAQWTLLSFVALYTYLSITGNLNIGLRHLFPILPFLYLLVAKTIADFITRRIEHENRLTGYRSNLHHLLFTMLGFGFIAWMVFIPVAASPNFLSYFNEAVGSKNGYRYVTDSNYDWGQDLKRVKEFVEHYNTCVPQTRSMSDCLGRTFSATSGLDSIERTPIDTIRVDYFGGSESDVAVGKYLKPWHAGLDPEAGWYAISATFYQESIYKNILPTEKTYRDWILPFKPVARAGESIFIFHISEEDLRMIR